MLYSFNGEYPNVLPFRIKLSNGLTRTDPSTFTESEIIDAGYILVLEPPIIENWQTLHWENNNWIIKNKNIHEEKLKIIDIINKKRNEYIYTIRTISLTETTSILLDLRKEHTDLQNIRDLNQRAVLAKLNNETFSIQFKDANDQFHLLSVDDILLLGKQLTDIISQIYGISWTKIELVNNALTLEELYSIDLDSDWF